MSRVALLLALACVGCAAQPKPLQVPLAPGLAMADGVRVVLLDADLPALADTVKLAAGKLIPVVTAPWPLPAPAEGSATFVPTPVALNGIALAWHDPTHLRLTAQVGKAATEISLTPTGQVGCGLSWTAESGVLTLDATVQRDVEQVTVETLDTPSVQWQGAQLVDPAGCLAGGPAGLAAALADGVRSALASSLHAHLKASYLPVLRIAIAPALEQAGSVAVPERQGASPEARFSVRFADSPAVVNHAGAMAAASLAVSLDVDRHPCAVDVPLPAAVASPLAIPPATPGQVFLRRALVLDEALIQRLAWMAARAGLLCAQARDTLTTTLPPGWSGELLPQVDEWIEGPPTGARFWPGSSPVTRLIDTPAGPAIEWTMDDAQLDIIARVADTEMTVLTVTGGFRATLVPQLDSVRGLTFAVASVERLSTHQSSPLLGDLATPPSEASLSAVCEAALQGIFADAAVLPLLPLSPGPLPAGTVLTRVERSGHALWLWLEGGATP